MKTYRRELRPVIAWEDDDGSTGVVPLDEFGEMPLDDPEPTRATLVAEPFVVEDKDGKERKCSYGYLALDVEGFPYAVKMDPPPDTGKVPKSKGAVGPGPHG
jgi:hypothetical protein